jgi:hypothetical protein
MQRCVRDCQVGRGCNHRFDKMTLVMRAVTAKMLLRVVVVGAVMENAGRDTPFDVAWNSVAVHERAEPACRHTISLAADNSHCRPSACSHH